MKIVINSCFGGFGLSTKAMKYLIKKNSPIVKKTTVSDYTGGKGLSDFDIKKLKDVGDGFLVSFISSVLYDTNLENVWFDNVRDSREHSDLVEVVEVLGKEANGDFAELKVVEIPDGTNYEISDYDGIETIHEIHRSWS